MWGGVSLAGLPAHQRLVIIRIPLDSQVSGHFSYLFPRVKKVLEIKWDPRREKNPRVCFFDGFPTADDETIFLEPIDPFFRAEPGLLQRSAISSQLYFSVGL